MTDSEDTEERDPKRARSQEALGDQNGLRDAKDKKKRRKKKLVISGAPLEPSLPRASSSISPVQAAEDLYHRQQERQRRVDNVVKWCESFGTLRRIETKEDGSLHVYWKDWEVADMVSSICCCELRPRR